MRVSPVSVLGFNPLPSRRKVKPWSVHRRWLRPLLQRSLTIVVRRIHRSTIPIHWRRIDFVRKRTSIKTIFSTPVIHCWISSINRWERNHRGTISINSTPDSVSYVRPMPIKSRRTLLVSFPSVSISGSMSAASCPPMLRLWIDHLTFFVRFTQWLFVVRRISSAIFAHNEVPVFDATSMIVRHVSMVRASISTTQSWIRRRRNDGRCSMDYFRIWPLFVRNTIEFKAKMTRKSSVGWTFLGWIRRETTLISCRSRGAAFTIDQFVVTCLRWPFRYSVGSFSRRSERMHWFSTDPILGSFRLSAQYRCWFRRSEPESVPSWVSCHSSILEYEQCSRENDLPFTHRHRTNIPSRTIEPPRDRISLIRWTDPSRTVVPTMSKLFQEIPHTKILSFVLGTLEI